MVDALTQDGTLDAWAAAERQLADYIAHVLNMPIRDQVFIGDELMATGKTDLVMVQLTGGKTQGQGYTSGTNTWATVATVFARFIDRRRAQAVGTQLLRRANFPLEGDLGGAYPNLERVFPLDHPQIRSAVVRIANQRQAVICAEIRQSFRVVYRTMETENE